MQTINSKKGGITKTIIKHKGYIKKVTSTSLVVTVLSKAACSECHAKGACGLAGIQEKEIEVYSKSLNYSPGQQVTIVLRELLAFKALFYGYLFPFLLVLSTLIIIFLLTSNEILSGLISISILIPYYITLYFFRQHLKNVFKFELDETSDFDLAGITCSDKVEK